MIKLPLESLILLKQCLLKTNPSLIEIIYNDNNLTDDQYNDLREVVCDELIYNGFDEKGITKYGLILEDLIDQIGRLLK